MTEASARLRRLLSEKFPGSRVEFNNPTRTAKKFWQVDLSTSNAAWPDQIAKGMVTEIICDGDNSSSAGLIHALIHRAAREKQIIGMIDGADSLDVVSLASQDLSRLLWVRCRLASEALGSADLILRDNNFSMVIVDLKLNPEAELRKIPAMTWYRLQRLVEQTAAVCVVFTPKLLVSATRQRFNLSSSNNLLFKS